MIDKRLRNKIRWNRLHVVIPLIPVTLLAIAWEWWHFGPSSRIQQAARRYRQWIKRGARKYSHPYHRGRPNVAYNVMPTCCRYPDCVDNPEGKCIDWLIGDCEGPPPPMKERD